MGERTFSLLEIHAGGALHCGWGAAKPESCIITPVAMEVCIMLTDGLLTNIFRSIQNSQHHSDLQHGYAR